MFLKFTGAGTYALSNVTFTANQAYGSAVPGATSTLLRSRVSMHAEGLGAG